METVLAFSCLLVIFTQATFILALLENYLFSYSLVIKT